MQRKKEIKYFTKRISSKAKQNIEDYLAMYTDVAEDEEQFLVKDTDPKLNESATTQLLDNIHLGIIEHDQQKRNTRKKLIIACSSFAAGILIVAGIFLNRTNHTLNLTEATTIAKITQTNSTDHIQNIHLPDYSVAELYPNSTISYNPNFESNSRKIILSGKARFTVIKDIARPFTVYSHQIQTTALGTIFTVDESNSQISVKLYEGKILVEKADSSNKNDGYYLTAGTEIGYNISKDIFTPVMSFGKNNIAKSVKKKTFTTRAKPFEKNIIAFENVPIEKALDKLAQKYEVEIDYSKPDLKNINIIATVNKQQSIEKILNDISQMNNLQLRKMGNKKFELYR